MSTLRKRRLAFAQIDSGPLRERDLSFPEVADRIRDHCDQALCKCGQDLKGEEVRGYPHISGWWTDSGKMWLYIHCPTCGYDVALWKIGVDRDQDFRSDPPPVRQWTEGELCDLAWAAPDPEEIRVIAARGRSR